MALSFLGSGRRRWAPCRAAAGTAGTRRAAGCRHFHIHYHFPRQQQVRAFSPLRLPPLFSLLMAYMLVLPVLFLAVLAFLVCFGWFTFVHFVACLLGKRSNSCTPDEFLEINDRDAGATSEHCRNEEQSGQELLGSSSSSVKEQQLQETSLENRFVGESTGISKESYGTANLVHLQYVGQENRKEDPAAYIKSEILQLVDKHETRTVAVICSDNSADPNNVIKSGADVLLPDDDFFAKKKVPEDFLFDASTLREEHHFIEEEEKHILCVSDETNDLNCGEGAVATDVATPNNASFDHTSSDEEDGHDHEKELTEDTLLADASGTASVASDFCEEISQAIREEIDVPASTENIIDEVASSGESSVTGRSTEDDEDENSCASKGGSRRLPLIKRSQPPWWNLCGVLEVFTGCNKD